MNLNRRRLTYTLLACSACVLVLIATAIVRIDSTAGSEQQNDTDTTAPGEEVKWYVPEEADFRDAYDKDKKNQSKQKWDNYWSWVKQYYDGNLWSKGWTKESANVIAGVKDAATRDKLRGRLNELGRLVAAEWSKDNGVRKISTQDLTKYGNRFLAAKKKDDGSGKAIQEEIDVVQAEVKKRLE